MKIAEDTHRWHRGFGITSDCSDAGRHFYERSKAEETNAKYFDRDKMLLRAQIRRESWLDDAIFDPHAP